MHILTDIEYRGENVTVKVLDVFTSSRGQVARVKALEGQPFKAWTHGGWSVSDTTTIMADELAAPRIALECNHDHVVNAGAGGYHYSGGDQWDDVRLYALCLDCMSEVEA